MTALIVGAPINGKHVSAADFSDPVFSSDMLGPTVAVLPNAAAQQVTVTAPVDGKIISILPHAFLVETSHHIGILVHLGIDTFQLQGSTFTTRCEVGSTVHAGDPVIDWSVNETKEAGYECPLLVSVLDVPLTAIVDRATIGPISQNRPIMTVRL